LERGAIEENMTLLLGKAGKGLSWRFYEHDLFFLGEYLVLKKSVILRGRGWCWSWRWMISR
jgi:hypothetical protein